nr:MAG TPA: hypothetical protein [Caudoviricetes sp.]
MVVVLSFSPTNELSLNGNLPHSYLLQVSSNMAMAVVDTPLESSICIYPQIVKKIYIISIVSSIIVLLN